MTLRLLCTLLLFPLLVTAQPSARGGLGLSDSDEGEIPDAAEVLQGVRNNLPPEALNLTGFIRTRRGREQQDRRLRMKLRFGDPVPTVYYFLSDALDDAKLEMRIQWPFPDPPQRTQWDADGNELPEPAGSDEILDTGLTWSDLSLDFLWWTQGAEFIGVERVRARDAYHIRLEAPPERPDLQAVDVWVDQRAWFVVRAEVFDADGERIRRIDVDSIQKIAEDRWMVKDLLIRDFTERLRIGIRFEDVEEVTR